MTLTVYNLHYQHIKDRIRPNDHKVFQFPAGESHVAFEPEGTITQIAFLQGASGDDLISLAMWADGCHRQGVKTIACIPYLPGARQDRGIPLGAKVYADLINSMNFDEVVCVDPHSDVAPALYNNLTVINLADLPIWQSRKGYYSGVIIPDQGARKRAESVAAILDVPTFQAQKHRDFKTGKLSGFSCERLPDSGNLIVVDDICDGGGTFLGLATVLGIERERLSLWVTHGVYSNGAIPKLDAQFGEILNTNSHPGYIQNSEKIGTSIDLLDIMVSAATRKRIF